MKDICNIEFKDGTVKQIVVENSNLQKAYEDNNINYEDVVGVEKVGEA